MQAEVIMKSKKSRLPTEIIAAALACTLTVPALAVRTYAAKRSDVLSPAIAIIASSEIKLNKAAISENPVCFSADDFTDILGVKSVKSVSIASVPDPSKGKLMLGGLEVLSDQVISGENLNQLRFIPTSHAENEASFSFRVSGNQDYEIPCNVYFLSEENKAPVISDSDKNALKLETIKNITVFDSMKGSDPENGSLTYEIVKYPESGILTVIDKSTGDYKYTPVTNYVGDDSFEYRVLDKYGSTSDVAKVNISVESPYTQTVFEDMIGRKEHIAAIRLSEKEIMKGSENEDGKLIFSPEKTITREEFIAMAMKATGKTVSVSAINTGFLDDDSIQSEYKSYIAVASQLGIVNGVAADGGYYFYPDREITRAEASVMLNKILGLSASENKPVFSDASTVPAWAENDITALSEHGILDTSNGCASPNEKLTRAEAAEMLYKAIKMS